MTARHFANTCPDCNRWRCVCNADGCPDCGEFAQECACIRRENAEAYDTVMAACLHPLWQALPVRTGPPPPAIRERLAQLRAECAAHLASLGRRV